MGCNSNSDQQALSAHLVANYYIRYLEPEKQVKAEVSFFKKDTSGYDTPLRMNNPVKFQGQAMGHRELPDGSVRYNFENFFSYPTEFVFEFNNLENLIQKQVLKLAALRSFSMVGEASRSKGAQLSLEGNEFQKDESLVILLSDLRTNTFSIEFDLEPGMTSLDIPAEKLAQLEAGAIKMYLVRKQVQQIEEPGYILNSTIEYYSKDLGFLLTD